MKRIDIFFRHSTPFKMLSFRPAIACDKMFSQLESMNLLLYLDQQPSSVNPPMADNFTHKFDAFIFTALVCPTICQAASTGQVDIRMQQIDEHMQSELVNSYENRVFVFRTTK